MYFQYSSPRTDLPHLDSLWPADAASGWELIDEPVAPTRQGSPHNITDRMDWTARTSLDLTDLALAATGAALLASALLW